MDEILTAYSLWRYCFVEYFFAGNTNLGPWEFVPKGFFDVTAPPGRGRDATEFWFPELDIGIRKISGNAEWLVEPDDEIKTLIRLFLYE